MLSTKGAARIRSNEIGTYSYAKTSNHSMAFAAHSSERTPEAQDIRPVIDAIPTLAWSARADGSADFFNQRWLDYTGLSAEQALDWGWKFAYEGR